MFWRDIGAQRYLIRVASRGSQPSLGLHSADLEAVYTRFMARKTLVEQRLTSLKALGGANFRRLQLAAMRTRDPL